MIIYVYYVHCAAFIRYMFFVVKCQFKSDIDKIWQFHMNRLLSTDQSCERNKELGTPVKFKGFNANL